MKRSLIAVIGVAAAGAIWFVTADRTAQAETITLRPADAGIVATGAEIYATTCASCHGAALEGQPDWKSRNSDGRLPAPPHDPTGHTWHHPDQQLLAIVTHGTEAIVGGDYRSNMMGFGEILGEAEIVDVMAYIKSTWPDEVIEIHNEINARASAYR